MKKKKYLNAPKHYKQDRYAKTIMVCKGDCCMQSQKSWYFWIWENELILRLFVNQKFAPTAFAQKKSSTSCVKNRSDYSFCHGFNKTLQNFYCMFCYTMVLVMDLWIINNTNFLFRDQKENLALDQQKNIK